MKKGQKKINRNRRVKRRNVRLAASPRRKHVLGICARVLINAINITGGAYRVPWDFTKNAFVLFVSPNAAAV